MANPPIQKIIIVGGGTAGWMAASALKRYLQQQPIEIVLVESDDIGTVGVGEASVPIMKMFNDMLGIDEWEFIKQTSGSFKLGIEFCDWGHLGSRYFHCFGDFGADIDGVASHHHWLKLRAQGDPTPLAEYSFPMQAACANRFAPPPQHAKLAAAAYKYAYHFDASLYAKFLRRYAEEKGVVRREGEVSQVVQDQNTGNITGFIMSSGETIEGDFFIDCSGFSALLIEQALRTGYEDWSHWLPCDRAVVAPCQLKNELTPYTVSTARAAGWQWRIPLQHRVGNGYVYASRYTDAETAERTLLEYMESSPLIQPRTLRFTTGHRKQFWNKNCIALGLAAGFLEPLESTSIQLIQTGILRFLEFFPNVPINEVAIAEYNRITSNEYARIRDFLILHYCTTKRSDTELWRYCRAMTLPDALQHKIDVFKHTARVPLLTEESYMEPSWVSIFVGQDIIPEFYATQANFIQSEILHMGMKKRREVITRLVATMPMHKDFIADVCPSKAS